MVSARPPPEQFRGRVPSFSSQLCVLAVSHLCALGQSDICCPSCLSVKAGDGSFCQVNSAKLSQHPRAAGSAGHSGERQRLLPASPGLHAASLPRAAASSHRSQPQACALSRPTWCTALFPLLRDVSCFYSASAEDTGVCSPYFCALEMVPREAEKPEYFSNVTHVDVQDEGPSRRWAGALQPLLFSAGARFSAGCGPGADSEVGLLSTLRPGNEKR